MLVRVLNSAGLEAERCALLLGISPDVFREWSSSQSPIPESVFPLLSAVLSVPQELLAISPRSARCLDDADVTPPILVQVSQARTR